MSPSGRCADWEDSASSPPQCIHIQVSGETSGPRVLGMGEQRLGLPAAGQAPCLCKETCAVRVCAKLLQLCLTLCNPMDCSLPGSSVCGDSPGKNTGVGCRAFFQGVFPTQGSNPGLSHCRRILYHLSHQGSPRILEWVSCLFCRESF